jgi:hypothetical protein
MSECDLENFFESAVTDRPASALVDPVVMIDATNDARLTSRCWLGYDNRGYSAGTFGAGLIVGDLHADVGNVVTHRLDERPVCSNRCKKTDRRAGIAIVEVQRCAVRPQREEHVFVAGVHGKAVRVQYVNDFSFDKQRLTGGAVTFVFGHP